MSRLPDFVVVGAVRSGTTSLYRHLADHPQVFMAPGKELRFFDRRYDRGLDWYRAQFDAAPDGTVVGEASPDYLHAPGAVERLAEAVPDVKAIAILRDPVRRAYSHYRMDVARRRECRSWPEVVAAEWSGEAGRGYLSRSCYGPQLERLFDALGRDRCHVLAFEHLRDEPGPTFHAVCRFLGVDEVEPPGLGRTVNEHFRIRSRRVRTWGRRLPGPLQDAVARVNQVREPYEPMDPALEAELGRWFAADRARVEDLLGWDAAPWGS